MPAPKATVVPTVPPRHPMITRACDGIHMPNPKYAHVASTAPSTPSLTLVRAALHDPNWHTVMQDEFGMLQANGTWNLFHDCHMPT